MAVPKGLRIAEDILGAHEASHGLSENSREAPAVYIQWIRNITTINAIIY